MTFESPGLTGDGRDARRGVSGLRRTGMRAPEIRPAAA